MSKNFDARLNAGIGAKHSSVFLSQDILQGNITLDFGHPVCELDYRHLG
jgi:hypothetical protein